ncbi:hypothetical protein P8813_15935 [Bacillus velezensis]|nr:hypothetical protein [Bacillus velezensis]MEC0384557.1 hypothetical protein [Bacillus velezensis]
MKYLASFLLFTLIILFVIGGLTASVCANSNMYQTTEVRVGM